MKQALNFTPVMARDYYKRLIRDVTKASNRIVLAAMIVRAGPEVSTLLEAIAAAAKRGVRVHVLADNYAQHLVSRSDYQTPQVFKAECAETRELFGRIHVSGGQASWVGRLGLNPYSGRYHSKITVVDDQIYTFGGVNMSDDSLDNIDYMLSAHNAELADRLEHLVASNARSLPASDIEIPLDAQNVFLFDAGKRGDSVIYDQACRLTERAKNIIYISLMCPSGRLGALIKRTKNTCYYNHPTKTGFRPDTLAQMWDNWQTGIENHYEGTKYVHAKVMLFELKDGTKASLSGSHNFSARGVAFGTKEIALYSTDPQLWRRLHDVVYAVATIT